MNTDLMHKNDGRSSQSSAASSSLVYATTYADVYIVSTDKKFSRMLQLVLEEDGLSVAIVSGAPKKRCFTIADLDTSKQADADVTFSKDPSLNPTFLRPFELGSFMRTVRSKLSSEENEDEDFSLMPGAVLYGKSVIPLSEIEHSIFEILLERRGNAVTSEEITKRVWQGNEKGNSLVVYINYLRKKLDFRFGKRFIVTVRGIGYMLVTSGEIR